MPSLDLIGIVTKNLSESLRFYRMLGLEISEPTPDDDHVEATLPNGLRLAWDKVEMVKSFMPDWKEPVGHRMAMAFLCASPGEVDQLFEDLEEAGYKGKTEPWDAFWGQRYAQIEDPDGNVVDLFAPLG